MSSTAMSLSRAARFYEAPIGKKVIMAVTGAVLFGFVVARFKDPVASIVYIIAMSMLGTHLYHGLWSMFQSVGVSHPRYNPAIKLFAKLAAAFLVLGNISIPISVMVGLVN